MDLPAGTARGQGHDARGEHLADFLDLEVAGPDAFQGMCHAGAPHVAFGGQLTAQALYAAGLTLDGAPRRPHSLHAYFLEAAGTSEPVRYDVERTRDGSSLSARRVVARQGRQIVFAMSASFGTWRSGPTHQRHMPVMPAPEACLAIEMPVTRQRPDLAGKGYPIGTNVEVRVVGPEGLNATERPTHVVDEALWVRVAGGLPQDPLLASAALAYLSDMRLDRTALAPLGGLEQFADYSLVSLDHAMWFHSEMPTGEWLLFLHDSPAAGASHGFSRGTIYSEHGALIASTAQECLIRAPSGHS